MAVADGSHRWNTGTRKPRASVSHNQGYVVIPVRDVSDDMLPMYRAMQKSQQPLLEHRWEMAKHLKRALMSHEMVDHKDGDKHNNEISNLRLYIKGKQQPGSSYGYGTYYHEWQIALTRIADLEQQISLR